VHGALRASILVALRTGRAGLFRLAGLPEQQLLPHLRQHVSANGTSLWATDGIVVASWGAAPTSTSLGGERRVGQPDRRVVREPVQQLGHPGAEVHRGRAPQWTATGAVVCTAANEQNQPQAVPDGTGGACVAWQDYRNGNNYDLYAQRLKRRGGGPMGGGRRGAGAGRGTST